MSGYQGDAVSFKLTRNKVRNTTPLQKRSCYHGHKMHIGLFQHPTRISLCRACLRIFSLQLSPGKQFYTYTEKNS